MQGALVGHNDIVDRLLGFIRRQRIKMLPLVK